MAMIKKFFSHFIKFLEDARYQQPLINFVLLVVSIVLIVSAALGLAYTTLFLVTSQVFEVLRSERNMLLVYEGFHLLFRFLPSLLLSTLSVYLIGKDSWRRTRRAV